ncbi:serine/threonine protein kinase [bacterium]|nr:serine/threonine protein kinase [bacterium]
MKSDTIVSIMGLEKENKFKEMPNDGIGALGTVFALIVGFFGVIAFFVSLMVNIDENPAAAMLGGIVLLLFAATYIYFTRIRQKKGATDSANVKRLEDRMENLEALICRLDRELNQQLEQSLMLTKPGQFQGGMSQMQTSLLSVTSALEERFQILRELGHGGMGVVLQAYDKQLKEQVAIKVLSPLVGRNPEAIERLRREVSAARRVTHPNVIRIHDVSEAGGLSYISMEYFEGVNLKEYIRQNGPLSIVRAFQIMDQIADGLEEAHRNGVIHRDLKSQNVIINRANQIKIIDFGLARSQHLDGMTATGLIMGTPEYMSPEQVAGKSVDERSDIYAFGIILYELLTGRVPFTGESAISIGFKQIKDDPPTPRTFNPGIPEELERVILKALNKDPLERYHSCSELKQELQRAMQSPVRFVPPASSRQDIAELEVSGRQDAGVTKR